VPATDSREQLAPRFSPDPSAIALRLPAPFKRTPSGTIRGRPNTPARRAGAEQMQIRVLVAEDHPLERAGVIRALEHDRGIEVVGEANSGVTAINLGSSSSPT
jgi:hypothetical protein